MAYKPKFIKQAALRGAAKEANRRVSAEAIERIDKLVGELHAKLVTTESGKKTVDGEAAELFARWVLTR